jgi:hypothetical protein
LFSPAASAAPLPADYTATAGGEVVNLDVNVLGGIDVAGVRLVSTTSASGSTLSPRSSATASDLAADVAALGLFVNSESQTAPPDAGGPETGTLAAVTVPGLLNVGVMDTTVEAHYDSDETCVPGNLLADSLIETTAGVSLAPAGIASILTTGAASTRSTTELVTTTGLNRAVRATAVGSIADIALLGGLVEVEIADDASLTATATGEPGGASVVYTEPTVTVTVGGSRRRSNWALPCHSTWAQLGS